MGQSNRITPVILFLSLITLYGCQDLVPRDTQSLFLPGLQRSEIFGFLAGMGTTFAAVPDLVSMLKRRSRAGMYPMMAAIMGTFQILWIYHGILIASRPVIAWNVVAVLINFLTVGAYGYFGHKEKPKCDREHQHDDPTGPVLVHAATTHVRTAWQSSGRDFS
jgi:MtN3 and saliva related transmembrane protein